MVMHSNDKHLLDSISHESRLPEIDADACVYATFDQANCKACVDACPRQAWVLDDDALGLDADAIRLVTQRLLVSFRLLGLPICFARTIVLPDLFP